MIKLYFIQCIFKMDENEEPRHLYKDRNEIDILSNFLDSGDKSVLAHPLTETYLTLKYLTVRKFFMINIFLYVLYLMIFTSLTWLSSRLKYHNKNVTSFDSLSGFAFFLADEPDWYVPWHILYWSSCITLFFITVRELIQLARERLNYFKSKENLGELTILVSSWIFLAMVPWAMEDEVIFGAIAIFLGWMEMTLLLGTIPSMGIFTHMYIQIIHQMIILGSVYITTLIAFACAFHLLLIRDDTKNGVFDNPWTSFLKVYICSIYSLTISNKSRF